MARRGENIFRRKDGRWEARVSEHRENGNKIYRSLYGIYIRYERFLKRNGFGKYTFHALRHTFATRGIESGFDIKSLSEILGHSDVTTTLRCYHMPATARNNKKCEKYAKTY